MTEERLTEEGVQALNEERVKALRERFILEDNKETVEEATAIYQKVIDDYTKHVNDEMSVEEAEIEEKAIIQLAEDWDKEVAKKKYRIPEKINFEGHTYTREEVGKIINKIIGKIGVEFKYVLGMYQLYEFWNNPKPSVDFNTFNTTVKALGQSGVQYTGGVEWLNAMIVDAFFKKCNRLYSIDILRTLTIASCHSAIMDKIKLNTPVEGTEGSDPDVKA